jgi:hypothetical protein
VRVHDLRFRVLVDLSALFVLGRQQHRHAQQHTLASASILWRSH